MNTTNDLALYSLADLAARIRAKIKRGVEDAMDTGDLLVTAKSKLGHGQWQPWLRDHCHVSLRTARAYVQLANEALALPEPDLEYHSYNLIFPVCDETVRKIAESIASHGLIHPIMLFHGQILDGKLRYLACKKAGVEPVFEEFEGDEEAALGFVKSMNLERSSYTSKERAETAAKLLELVDRKQSEQHLNEDNLAESLHEAVAKEKRLRDRLQSDTSHLGELFTEQGRRERGE